MSLQNLTLSGWFFFAMVIGLMLDFVLDVASKFSRIEVRIIDADRSNRQTAQTFSLGCFIAWLLYLMSSP